MNKKELKAKIESLNIPKTIYSLEGGLPDNMFTLEEAYGLWKVYHSERGKRMGEVLFYSEEEACDYFYKTLLYSLKN